MTFQNTERKITGLAQGGLNILFNKSENYLHSKGCAACRHWCFNDLKERRVASTHSRPIMGWSAPDQGPVSTTPKPDLCVPHWFVNDGLDAVRCNEY